ncbi:hypothetical protein [Dactylosporangium sp. NPDC006015]|uniref:hypothetical protein n=1 Tax=Dactylosporangium sp. NPDC006015 TaxID=3154576 RepID=UPI0033B95A9B
MTSYGPGLLDLIPDADVLEGDPTGGDGVAWLLELAAIGLSRRFRVAVHERVAEFTYDDGRVGWRWLPGDEAAPILAAGTCFGDADRDWPAAMDHDLFVPNCTAPEAGNVEAPGSPVDGWYYTPIEPVVSRMREVLAEIDRGDYDYAADDAAELLDQLEFCRTHDLMIAVV